MSDKEIEKSELDAPEIETREFSLTDFKMNLVSSAEMLQEGEIKILPENELKFATGEEQEETELDATEEPSEIFKELSEPKLPALPSENRARLQMQSPNRIFFYWSLKNNPFQTLQKMFGARAGEYTFVAKLIDVTNQTENFHSIPVAGSWWFDVESDSIYKVEVGFAAPNRPFVRLLFSNTVETPRSAPSPYFDLAPQFAVSTPEFAEVLEVSGYKQDAFELALAGDAPETADAATRDAFFQLTGATEIQAQTAELRFVLFALAAGATLEDLRGQITPRLFGQLEKLFSENAARLSAENVFASLQENFDLEDFDETEEESAEVSYRTFGASLVNFHKFPRRLAKRIPKLPRRPETGFSKFSSGSSRR